MFSAVKQAIVQGRTAGVMLLALILAHLVAVGADDTLVGAPGIEAAESADSGGRPTIEKLGTVDVGMVETQPIVFGEKLYRLESVRPGYSGNKLQKAYLRLVEVATGAFSAPFAEGHGFTSALVIDDTMYVAGTPVEGASSVDLYRSKDLKNWESHRAIATDGWELFNTSLARDADRYVMAFEVGAPPEVAGERFTIRFAVSNDMLTWAILPEPAVYTKERYSACPALRWMDGWYFMTYLEAVGNYQFHTYLVRSRNLEQWEASPLNPVLQYDEADKRIFNDTLNDDQRQEISKALNRNNSDLDLCQWQGKVIINYSWGDQVGHEFLAQAKFNGTLVEFFDGFFPNTNFKPQSRSQGRAIDE